MRIHVCFGCQLVHITKNSCNVIDERFGDIGNMVRNYKKKRDSEINEDDVKKAVLEVVGGTMKLRRAAEAFNVKPNTLFYRIKQFKENIQPKCEEYTTKYTVSQVFNNNEENMIKQYLLKSSKMNYGLTYKQARGLAFEYAKALKKCPPKWEETREAGIEWLKGFMKRHKDLSLRKPENTSLSRSTSFNKHNVSLFYDNYEVVQQKHRFTPDRIYNLDETNIMTVVQAPNVIAQTGAKQVGQSVSAERGQLITMCGIVNAIGNTLPPVFIFPRARFHDTMLFGAPAGSVGYANCPSSGWMTGPLFLKVLEHIKKLTRCSTEDSILITMDNHESHCTLDAIQYCRANGMVLLTFPPHCTHRMQPLDVAVNGPFKQKLAVAQNDWLLNHPGRTITIHDLASIVTPAYNLSYTARNILSGFSKPGIVPFSRNAFSDEDFECAEVTNRPLQETITLPAEPGSHSPPEITAINSLPRNAVYEDEAVDITAISSAFVAAETTPELSVAASEELLIADVVVTPETARTAEPTEPTVAPEDLVGSDIAFVHEDPVSPVIFETSIEADILCNLSSEVPIALTSRYKGNALIMQNGSRELATRTNVLTPERVKPFPKAPLRKVANRGRKKGKSRILTDTPEKDEIEKTVLERQKRLQKIVTKQTCKGSGLARALKIKRKRKQKIKSKLTFSDSDTDLEKVNSWMPREEDSDITDCDDGADVETEAGCGTIKTGDFVRAQVPSLGSKRMLAYVGKIVEKYDCAFNVRFLKKKAGFNKFHFPEKEDRAYVSIIEILAKLPPPIEAGSTSRTAAMFSFKFDFSRFKLG